jgi:predicted secreted protein
MNKLLLLFAVAGLSVAGAKSYDITFAAPAVLGTTLVPAGQYQLKLDGSKVTLVNAESGKHLAADATVTAMPQKFSETIVQSKRVDGKDLVDVIQLGGTTTALDFKH